MSRRGGGRSSRRSSSGLRLGPAFSTGSFGTSRHHSQGMEYIWIGAIYFMLLCIIGVISDRSQNTTEVVATVDPNSQYSFPTISDFQFSDFCKNEPVYLLEGSSEFGSTKLTALENTPGHFKGKLEVAGKAESIVEISWNSNHLLAQLKDKSSIVVDSRESADYDPGGRVLIVGFDNSNDVVVFLLPFEVDRIGFAIAVRTDIVEYHSVCQQ